MKTIIFILSFILIFSGCNRHEEPTVSDAPVLEYPTPDESISEEPKKETIFNSKGFCLNDANGLDFPEDKIFQPVPETGGRLYIVSEHSDNCLTKNDSARISPATLYYKTSAGKSYTLASLPVYDYQDPRISFVHLTGNFYSLCTPDKSCSSTLIVL